MKFSEAWLREWVNPQIDSNALCEQITMAGLEVDTTEPVAGEFSGVIVGKVIECQPHPDADKLRVTQVNIGASEPVQIVCGAPNCRQGLKVAVATVGALLPDNFKIKKAKLRGQPSNGMLCSASELGLSEDHDGIIELPLDAPVGQNLREYLQLNDISIDIDLTPNRADCLSIAGIAREVGVLNQLDVTPIVVDDVIEDSSSTINVSVEAPEECPRYLGRVIENVDLSANTPLWMKEKLRRSGIRSIDPIVDVTNYVMLELGQPLHAFDANKVSGSIHVRLATDSETLITLDEQEVKLSDNTLVIADDNGPIALAGIFGGLHSGVTKQSQSIFLESAFFAPLAITGRARQYGLHTDASHRFERGVDWQLQETALQRASALIQQICGGQAGPVIVAENRDKLPKPQPITLRHARLNKLIGQEFSTEQVCRILNRLGLDVKQQGDTWTGISPSYRFDLEIEQDLIEEIARVYGYNEIPNVSPNAHLKMALTPEASLALGRLRDILVNRDYQEAVTYSFVDPKKQQKLHPQQEAMNLPNPIASDMSQMRLSLWTGLLDTISYNQKRQQPRIRVFETGLRFIPDATESLKVRQEPMIGGAIVGPISDESWHDGQREVDFFDIKGDVEALISASGCEDEFEFIKAEHPALHPGQSAQILRCGKCVGWVGAIHPQLEKTYSLSGRVFMFELLQSALIEGKIPHIEPVSKYPSNRRDLAIVVNSSVNAADLIKCVRKNGTNQLVGVNLFDVYQGKGVPEGKKSIALSLTLQDKTHTLDEAEIVAIVDDIVAALKSEFDASLRD
ncbi:phenylalanine--tRNA ligase subunit beta [Celerinatantimonas diazotrophica]|uniref:Phenylalanine--tRNA ligase beta subunit n=1 Tax=Celerinatantimonas diazotrophica TaxID=412034 RepID=A0A4R1JAI8_9GAMM|nr:phenylalanine--tRNA ligase subunit beta [Celerinatantimonas diazotrophica]TCK47666.1 phenylalanyl-tRNA synthetase beta subunit [Celerinatantimonas diazotrophica]CAG9296709.1 Phenylalanine--tRNA ligase beta subunit [Celerinatantimonas diazotrophica]